MSTSNRKALKTSFRASPRSIRPLYTGGPVLITHDGQWLITTMGEEVLVTEVSTGQAVGKVRGDGSAITSLALSYHTTPPTLITCHLSTTLRYYPLPEGLPSTSHPTNLTYTRQNLKAHGAPILVSAISPDSTLLATGSSDGIVKLWDLAGGYVTHLFRGHGGPVSALKFHFVKDDLGIMELWTGSTDGKVRIFDLRDTATSRGGGGSKAKAILEGHVSVVRGIDISEDGKWAITGGRDKVVLVWDISSQSGKQGKGKGKAVDGPKVVQTIIVGELVETLGLLPTGESVLGQTASRLRCWTGGDSGKVRIWEVLKGESIGGMQGVEGVDEAEVDEDEQQGILNVIYDKTSSSLISIHADQNIIYQSISSGLPTRQIVGFNDEIVDATFLTASGSSHTHLALAANSNLIRLYSTETFNVRLLSGHKDMVLCLDKPPDYKWLASGSKDHTARIWAPDPSNENGEYRCIAICEGHAESIGAVAFSKKTDGPNPRFLITASQDRTIKMWDLSSLRIDGDLPEEPIKPKSLTTLRAHEKDINSLDISPNDRFLASGSQDKLVKIFEMDYTSSSNGGDNGATGSIRLAGTCKGHRRGVWTVRFSKNDRIVASGAADRTVKLWSLDDFSCLKTFEGHTNSVLRVDFLTQGMQLITSASDGLVKLWNIRDEECIKTLDNHEDKIWALAISSDEKTLVSAGADSLATIWEDSTQIEQEEKNQALIESVQSEQDFTNYLALKDYKRAIQLALSMGQPGRLLHLFNTINKNPVVGSLTGSLEVDSIIKMLGNIDIVRLLKFVRDWNSNARTSGVAQTVLFAIMKLRSPEELIRAFESVQKSTLDLGLDEEGKEEEDGDIDMDEKEKEKEKNMRRKKKGEVTMGMKEMLDGLIPYSERHFARIDKLVQESYMLDYVVGEMDGGMMFGGEVMDVDGMNGTNGH